uniref:Fibroblast growth factor n=2 Tax=Crocodylus porosus TaxID=8502 RepID=A0A7M4FVQ0_CROPO
NASDSLSVVVPNLLILQARFHRHLGRGSSSPAPCPRGRKSAGIIGSQCSKWVLEPPQVAVCSKPWGLRQMVIYFGISVILGILEIFAVSQGIVGIRGVFSNNFLAMSKKGKLHASAKFTEDCKFRERFQENSYNTYASAIYRTEKTGREWYVALNKRGKAKRGCSPRVKPQHISTHFLPRFKQSEQPELSFTVTVPEKKKLPASTPAKPKVSLSVPRKNPNTVKYRLKFRFG